MADTAAQLVKRGLDTAARAAIAAADPGAVVTFDFGEPDTWSDDTVLTMRVTSTQLPGPISPRRVRDETVEVELHIVTRRTTQLEADDRAYALLGWIAHHVRMVDPTLGGVALWCFMTGHDADGFTPDQDRLGGRGTEIIATFTARCRISDAQ
jgi:hypothetical protein